MESNRRFFLLTAAQGLIPPEQLVRLDPGSLKEADLDSKANLVVRELNRHAIVSLSFFANPLERERMNFIRLIVLACERSDPKVSLELVNHDGSALSDWGSIMDEANQAKRRADEMTSRPVRQFFDSLLAKFPDDGMVWYRLAESHQNRKELQEAQEAFANARERFQLKEWRDLARHGEDGIKSIRRPRTEASLTKGEIDVVSRLRIPEDAIKALSLQALDLMARSPMAAVALCRTVLIRIIRSIDPSVLGSGQKDYLKDAIDLLRKAGRISQKVADDMHAVRMRRNDIEFATTIPNPQEARVTLLKLVEILKQLYPVR
jgi:hypothetical protein